MPYLSPTSHATLLATLRRERRLPAAGEILVRTGQHVEAVEVVARAQVADHHRLQDVARDLGVAPDKAAGFMLKQDGQEVKKGEPLATRKVALGLSTRSSFSPVDGMLLVAGDGKALLAAISQPFELRAGMPGNVVNVTDGWAVSIETAGALLEGVWGNGRDEYAPLRVIGQGPQAVLAAEMVELGLRGSIVAVGALADSSAFKQLAEVAVRGLILGSAHADLLPALGKLTMPVLVVDGFGLQGFSAPAFNLLTSNEGREVWLNARAWDPARMEKPEAIIPLPSPAQAPPLPPDGEALDTGRRVRILRGPDAGRTGVVAAMSERSTTLPSGVRSRMAAVQLDGEKNKVVSIPFANLEILG